MLDAGVTVIHDEAALASTREQAWLLEDGERVGGAARDDRRPAPVAGRRCGRPVEGDRADRQGQDAFVELSRIVRAKDPADRRDQALLRAGQHEQALADYSERGLVVLEGDQRRAEDRALEAAQADRRRAGGRWSWRRRRTRSSTR